FAGAIILDALFVTGGMSMGTHDFVPKTLQAMGFELRITRLRIKPGKPFVFATAGGDRPRFVFGLPGNPVSAFVCTVRLASRLLHRIAGGEPEERWLAGKLESPLPESGPREFYQPAIYDFRDGVVRPLAWKG